MRAIPLKCQTGLVVVAFMTFAASGTAFAQSASADHSAAVRALSNPRPLDLTSLSAIAAAESRQANPRTSDSLLDGALIGAGVAIAGGLFLCTRTEPWENCRDDVGPIVRIGAIGAGVGI